MLGVGMSCNGPPQPARTTRSDPKLKACVTIDARKNRMLLSLVRPAVERCDKRLSSSQAEACRHRQPRAARTGMILKIAHPRAIGLWCNEGIKLPRRAG